MNFAPFNRIELREYVLDLFGQALKLYVTEWISFLVYVPHEWNEVTQIILCFRF